MRYLRSSAELSTSQVGTLISGLRRYVNLVRSLGGALPDSSSHFSVLWRLHRSWSLAIPRGFRTPVPHDVALAVTVTSWLAGWRELALLTLLKFHCLLRSAEARNVRWTEIHCFSADQQARYPGLFGLVGIGLPKTRRLPGHAWHKHVVVECPGLGRLLRAALSRPLANSVVPPAVPTLGTVLRDTPAAWCAFTAAHTARSLRRWGHGALAAAT